MSGEMKKMEGCTEGLIKGSEAASMFWQGVEGTGIKENDDRSM